MTSSATQSWRYDVYLSFRIEDTAIETRVADPLYHVLVGNGISVCKDDEILTRGGSIIYSTLWNAIEESRISVIIFSKSYADSWWCLEELTHIMRCRSERGQIVFPLFCDVDPSDVRTQTGIYEGAFKKHELDCKDKVETWRKALTDACSFAGWEYENINYLSFESWSMYKIVDRISLTLSSLEKTYDVFLCFGEDVRKTFVDHLYEALVKTGISIYKDDGTLPRGESIDPALFNAIKGSLLSIIILSKNFANSTWCLEELTYIMRCESEVRQLVLPVFYDVNPREIYLRKFGEAFENNKNKVKSWRNALSDVAALRGLLVKDIANGHEAESIKMITDLVSERLSRLICKCKERIEQDPHSSSSQSVPASVSRSWSYDVFISFRREDTRKNYVDHLYSALVQKGISIYKEDAVLPRGSFFNSAVCKAIEGSQIAIIIFSENYADSQWCLEEATYIMKCKDKIGKIVMPIFYGVDPSEVRKQKGKYEEAFKKHELNNKYKEAFAQHELENNRVESWRKALTDAANIDGWDVKNIANGNEVVCIEEIVGTISQLLHPVLSFSHELSSSPSSQCRNHDIFLSFIGEYDSKTFVDRLYSTLIQQGIHTYKSDGILSHGDSNGSFPLNAIEESQIGIIIFTKIYARSSRCLDELSYIMKCIDIRGMHVMPIFYDVSSSDVQEQSGEFGKEFDKQEWENMAKVESWRKALKGACNHFGWSLKDIANRHEGRYIKDIVKTVSHILLSLISKVKKDLIGIEPRLQSLTSKLAIGTDDVRMVVVGGIEGSGKTTIASCVYMEISRHFEGRCFVENIREESSKYGMRRLQKKILSTILKKEVVVPSDEEGRSMIQTMLCTRNVLIVLDDVIDIDQMLSLVGSRDSFGNGSIIIITSRYKHFPLNVNDVSYSVSLSYDEAVQLFERHAYPGLKTLEKGKRRPSSSLVEAYCRFSQDVISYANEHPLALKILGCFLHGKEENTWKSALVNLKDTTELEVTNKLKIMNKLKISYDGLRNVEKELFLDIACFFKGRLIDSSMMLLLDAFHVDPIKGVNELVQKSLITISNGMFGIHELVEEMAHYIVRGEDPKHLEEQSRIWQSSDVVDICATDTKKYNYKVQALYAPNNDAPPNLHDAVGNMKTLQLLDVRQHVKEVVQKPLFLSNKLRWISWENYPAISLPTSFQPNMLFSLILRNGLQKELWQGTKVLPRLKVLDLHGSKNLIMTPDFNGLPNLENLVLSGCSGLEEIHESIGNHEKLVYLNLEGCEKLKTFPPIITMPKLETLILSRCSRLSKFPEIKETMNALKHLHMDYSGIEDVPPTVGKYCINLVFINLIGCKRLENIKGNFQQLKRRCLILVD